jgi:hypothetical protein
MASRLTLMRLGWGYAMLGPVAWTVMLQAIERPAADPPVQVRAGGIPVATVEGSQLAPLLTGAGIVTMVVSVLVPLIVGRSRELRALFLSRAMPSPDASEAERLLAEKVRERRAFEFLLVAWVLSLLTAAIPGMCGLMLGFVERDLRVPYGFVAAALVLTAIRFPTARALRQAIEQV